MKKPEAIDPSKVIIIPRPPIAGTAENVAKNEAESTASKETESSPKVESPASSKAQTSIKPKSEK